MGLMAQTTPPAAPAGEVLGVGNFIHVVANLDKSIEFYRDVIGLELTGPAGPHLFSVNAVVSTLYDAPGAQSRVASLRIPGSEMAVEIVEFKDIDATPVRPRLQDPGAIILSLTVRNLDPVLARLKQPKTSREVLVSDPDGIFVRLTEGKTAGAGFGITIGDTEETMRLYRDVLGFPVQAGTAFEGPPDAQVRRSTALIPGTSFPMEFLEFKGTDRRPAHPAIHDPGASVLRLRVRDIDSIVKALRAAGNPVVSSGGEAISVGRSRAVIVRELNNLFLQPMQTQ
jgi:catechol 2,3-dioxygenase-like lactoylglutathione lyase family enzyme